MKKRVTPKQRAANRRNAQKSTGPKTVNGRAVSKMNALKHGILSKEVVVRSLGIKESLHELPPCINGSRTACVRWGRWRRCWWTRLSPPTGV